MLAGHESAKLALQHCLRVWLAAENAAGGERPVLRLAVLRLFERQPQPKAGMHRVSNSCMCHGGRPQAVEVDSLDCLLVSAAPPAGQQGHGSIWLLEYNAQSKLLSGL